MRSKRRSESLRLVGPRVELRPLTIDDWPAWREVRLRSKSWL
jgi:hypothetical protein